MEGVESVAIEKLLLREPGGQLLERGEYGFGYLEIGKGDAETRWG